MTNPKWLIGERDVDGTTQRVPEAEIKSAQPTCDTLPARHRGWWRIPVGLMIVTASCDVVDTTGGTPSGLLFNTADCHLVIWLKAFIDPGTTNPKYVTKVLPPTVYAGRDALRTDWYSDALGSDIFLTDGGGPLAEITAPSRMHSEVRFVITPGGTPTPTASDHITGTTVALDRNQQETQDILKCTAQASTTGMSWSDHNASGMDYSLYLTGSASNPCASIAPPIDYRGRLIVTNRGSHVRVRFVGSVDKYPSYEMYARDNDGVVKQIFYVSNANNTPLDLIGSTGVSVDDSVHVCHRQG